MSNLVSQTELDAAEALLQLRFFRSGNKENISVEQNVEQPPVTRSAMIKTFSTNTSTPTPNSFETEKVIHKNIEIPKTHGIHTQTEFIPDLLKIKKREEMIKEITAENLALKKQIRELKEKRSSKDSLSVCSSELSKEDSPESLRRSNKRSTRKSLNNTQSSSYKETATSNVKKFKSFKKEASDPEARNQYLSGGVVPIGSGYALVPAHLLKCMDWSSHSNATRKLLSAVFPRQVLATHSLTGKRSPAFPNKPPKQKLNESLVNDIVTTVSERCGVPESIVRSSITTKCADESKMLRTRMQPKRKIKKTKKEKVPPSDSSEISD